MSIRLRKRSIIKLTIWLTGLVAVAILAAGCGGGGEGETLAPDQLPEQSIGAFFTCDPLESGILVHNEPRALDDSPNARTIVELRVFVGVSNPTMHKLTVEIPPGGTQKVCAQPSEFVTDSHKLLVVYDDGTNGCVRFGSSPFLCAPTGDGRSEFYLLELGEVEHFKVTYRGR